MDVVRLPVLVGEGTGDSNRVLASALVAYAFDVLGPLRVIVDDVDVTPQAPKERSLLAMLVLQAGRVVRADRLIDELWSNLPVEQARRVLWVRVSGLRKLLNRAGPPSMLEFVAPGYRLAALVAIVPGRTKRSAA